VVASLLNIFIRVNNETATATRWRAEGLGVARVQQQAALDPELRAQIDKEAAEYYVTRLTEEFLAKGYSPRAL
jgi:hypothetical protein